MGKSAKYYKCALQMNPCNYAEYRGKKKCNEDEYNKEILDKCVKNDISIVGLADHGNVNTSQGLRTLLTENGITVFPGFEITTAEKMHIVCLFPEDKTVNELNQYIGAVGLSNANDGTSPSTKTCEEIAKIVNDSGGFWYAAHITGDNGILKLGKLNHIWKSKNLVAAQIPDSRDNIDPKFKNIVDNKDPQYKRDKAPAYINASDIEKPDDLDKPNATTLIKMSEPIFSSFVSAFKDPDSRVRLNYELETTYQSSIDRIRVFGGYLDGLDIELSSHLDTIIGGRGTGKSTVINLVRYAANLELDEKIYKERRKEFDSMIDNNLGSNSRVEIDITSYSQHGKKFKIIRRYKNKPVIEDSNGNVIPIAIADLLPKIEIYGQNEIVDTVGSSNFIYDILKRLFETDATLQTNIDSSYNKLHENTEQIIHLLDEADSDDTAIADLPSLKEQYKYFKESGIEDKLLALKRIASEEAAFESVSEIVDEIQAPEWTKIVFENETSDVELENLAKLVESYNKKLDKIITDFDSLTIGLKKEYKKIEDEWNANKDKKEEEIHKSLSDLEGIQDKSGTEIANEFAELVKKINLAEPIQKRQRTREKELNRLITTRQNLIEACRKAKDSYSSEINKQIKKLNKKKFDGVVKVSVSFGQNKTKLLNEIKSSISGIGDKGVSGILNYSDFDVLQFADDIRTGSNVLEEKYSMTSGTASKIRDYYNERNLYKLEEMQLDDVYELELFVNGEYKKLNRLSKGQQCTAVLNILLVDNKDPLIIDQPEDNLDNAFIADSLIKIIRENKIKRQYILATHNANIPVFGDAEMIITMHESDGHGCARDEYMGSIDNQLVKESVINVLEGGKDAFLMREKKYGL